MSRHRQLSPRSSATPGQRAAYAAGLSIRQIGEIWTISYATIHGRLKRAQVPIRARGGKSKPASTETIEHFEEVAREEERNK